MPRFVAVLALALAVTATACTHTHQVATTGSLPADSVDHGRGALEGAGIGLLTGAATGAVAGLVDGDDPPCLDTDWFCFRFDAGEKAVVLGLAGGSVGAVAGLVLGALVGSRDTYERTPGWVPLVSTSAAPGAASATATWTF
ncbi:MAG: hypothetical protein IPL61_33365 [Myxococcales bacterium]|nr:hypothetical protein [Myxococcales bacterium]